VQFSCIVSNLYGAIISSAATLIVTNAELNYSLSATLLPNQNVRITMQNPPANTFHVLVSSNLLTWQTLATLTNVTGSVQFTDPVPANLPSRFYRFVTP
jgi:hypothetical protein